MEVYLSLIGFVGKVERITSKPQVIEEGEDIDFQLQHVLYWSELSRVDWIL